jgi:hypothetical protein
MGNKVTKAKDNMVDKVKGKRRRRDQDDVKVGSNIHDDAL